MFCTILVQISPLESALTNAPLVTPLESALAKTPGEGGTPTLPRQVSLPPSHAPRGVSIPCALTRLRILPVNHGVYPKPILARGHLQRKMPEMNRLRHAKHLHSRPLSGTLRSFAAAILLLILSAAAPAFAQTPAAEPRSVITVSGTVRDSAGNPVADASVFFEEKAAAASAETKTKTDGTFSFLALRPGTYTVRAEKAGMRASASASLLLSLGERKQVDLVLESAQAKESPSPSAKKSGSTSAAMEFDDKPSFTVAGVTDWTNVGGHGSDTKLRTSETLAKETATLKSSWPAETPAPAAASPSAADLHRLAGDRAERSGDPLAPEREYEQAVHLDPSEENFPNLQQAQALLQKAVNADSKLDDAYVQLGILYSARANFPQAIGAYKKAIEVNPQSGEAHYRLALAYKRVGEEGKSEQELQLFKQADKSETAAVDQQRREIRQFLIILQDQPQASAPQPEKKK